MKTIIRNLGWCSLVTSLTLVVLLQTGQQKTTTLINLIGLNLLALTLIYFQMTTTRRTLQAVALMMALFALGYTAYQLFLFPTLPKIFFGLAIILAMACIVVAIPFSVEYNRSANDDFPLGI